MEKWVRRRVRGERGVWGGGDVRDGCRIIGCLSYFKGCAENVACGASHQRVCHIRRWAISEGRSHQRVC